MTEHRRTEALRALHASLAGRVAPENLITQMRALDVYGVTEALKGVPNRRHSFMHNTFDPPASLAASCRVMAELTGKELAEEITEEQGRDPSFVDVAVAWGRSELFMAPHDASFKADRLNRDERSAVGLGSMSRRRYNKLFRLTTRLATAAVELRAQREAFRLMRFAKTAFAADVPLQAFELYPHHAAFTAYYTANRARRSQFLAGPQARAFDSVAERLLSACWSRRQQGHLDRPGWEMIAWVYPNLEVLAELSDQQKGTLLAKTWDVLKDCARIMRRIADQPGVDSSKMIVSRGADSSTWNATAGAWNRARDFWLALMVSLGAQETFEDFLPGKAMRLIAADVARWHRSKGNVDRETKVWAQLPRPWLVLEGDRKCGREMVRRAVERAGLDPETKGASWLGPRTVSAVAWTPTPELVHGVTVADPELAQFLRRVGVFSGKRLRRMETEDRVRAEAGWEEHVVRV